MRKRIIGPMTAMDTIERLRSDLEFARAATRHQRAIVSDQRQLLARIERRHRSGDAAGTAWLIENWRTQLTKWARETKEQKHAR